MKNKYFNWTLVIIWMLLIFYSSSRSTFGLEMSAADYKLASSIAHVIIYAILTFLIALALISHDYPIKKALLWSFIIAIAYGLTDELHQYFVPGREMRLGDWLLDVSGSLLVVYMFAYKKKIKLFG